MQKAVKTAIVVVGGASVLPIFAQGEESLRRLVDTTREYDNLSSEWLWHNMAYDLGFEIKASKDADLDYSGDKRLKVGIPTTFLEFFGLE